MSLVDYEKEQSIIAHLMKMEMMISETKDKLNQKEKNEVRVYEECNSNSLRLIDAKIDEIRKKMLTELTRIINNANIMKEKIFADSDQYKNDIYMLYNENLEISKKIEEVQKKINKIEKVIGHDNDYMNHTK